MRGPWCLRASLCRFLLAADSPWKDSAVVPMAERCDGKPHQATSRRVPWFVDVRHRSDTIVQSIFPRESGVIGFPVERTRGAMSKTETHTATPAQAAPSGTVDTKFEFTEIPVSDVDRAKDSYARLGWKLDMDFVRGDDSRFIQVTPPGSPAPMMFGTGIPSTTSGPVHGLYLVVSDIVAARTSLVGRGVAVGEPFPDAGGVFHRAGTYRGPGKRLRAAASLLWHVRILQRSRREWLADAGGDRSPARPRWRGRLEVRLVDRSRECPAPRARRARRVGEGHRSRRRGLAQRVRRLHVPRTVRQANPFRRSRQSASGWHRGA